MDPRNSVTIFTIKKPSEELFIPNPDSLRTEAACQCEIGRQKLVTAPPYKKYASATAKPSRLQSAACVQETERYNCPLSHIYVTFKAPLHPGEEFYKAFPANTPIKYVKRKIAKLLSVSDSNLLFAKNKKMITDKYLLSQLRPDAASNLVIDVFTKDSDAFSLSVIPNKILNHKDKFQTEIPRKDIIPCIAIKFRIRNQNSQFTRSYSSILKVHEIKKNLAELFQVDPNDMVFLREEHPLQDRMVLLDIDYDKYGLCEVEIVMKNNQKLNLDKLYKESIVNDVLTINVPLGDRCKQITVEVFSDPIRKPYLGGYRDTRTGTEYHHAFTQTPQKPDKVPPERKNCRDTQTAEEREKIYDTNYSRATQMSTPQVYIPNVSDRILVPKPYETFEEMTKRLNHAHYATVIQRAFRHYQFRQKVHRWLAVCKERIERMKEEDRLELEAMDRRLRKDLITKTFPKTRDDFDQLYAMVDRWKHAEIQRITKLHEKGPKIAEFTLLLDKEVELLRCIEDYRVKVRNDSQKIKEQHFLEEISKPITWYGRSGKVIQMDTIEIQRARKLKELYNSFIRDDMEVNERLELLVDMKFALGEFRHPLAEEIIRLLDRECDLIVRRYDEERLDFLRRRITKAIVQFIKTSELNSGVTKFKDIRDFRKMDNFNLFLCEVCYKVKNYKEFPLSTRLSGFMSCKSCSWKDVHERLWIDMTPFKFILRALQVEERRRKCWGSLAFVMQEKDIFHLVEKLWHSHSAISECADVTLLRLCRWHVEHDWSPWNCFLVTVTEMKAHLKITCPEDVYDEELVQKVKTIHALAKANFEQLIEVNKRFTETGDWHSVRATALDRVGGYGVERV